LILAKTSAYLGSADQWDGRITSGLKADRSETAEMFLRNWFPAKLLRADGAMIAKISRDVVGTTDPPGFGSSYAAVRDMDMRRTIALISCPTLVIAGQYDTVTLPAIASGSPRPCWEQNWFVYTGAHLSNWKLRRIS